MVDAQLRFAAANLANIKKPDLCASHPEGTDSSPNSIHAIRAVNLHYGFLTPRSRCQFQFLTAGQAVLGDCGCPPGTPQAPRGGVCAGLPIKGFALRQPAIPTDGK